MQVRFQGFNFEPGKVISKEKYLGHLLECGEDGGDFEFYGRKRIFHLTDSASDDYYAGLFVTIRDHKKMCSLNGYKKIVVLEAGSDEHLMDFNYFVIHKKSYRGLYQHYHQSCSVNQFGNFMKHRYNDLRDIAIANDLKPITQTLEQEDKEKLIRKKKKKHGPFLMSAEVKREDLETMLNELNKVSSFDYCFNSVEDVPPKYKPLTSNATRVYQKVVYSNKASVKPIVKNISSFIDNNGIKVGNIRGYDPEGVEKLIKLVDNPSYFAVHDFVAGNC